MIRIKSRTNKKIKRVKFIPIEAILTNGNRRCILSDNFPNNGGKMTDVNTKQVIRSWIIVISTFK